MSTVAIKRLCRRSVLGGGLAFVTLPLMARFSAGAIPESGVTRFAVNRNGNPLGSHVLTFRPDGDDLHVRVEIDFRVGIGPISFFRYQHRNDEIWRGNRLLSLDSTTDDDGDQYRVTARAEGDKLLVDGTPGRLVLPGDTLSTSYWHEATIDRSEWLDTQKGELVRSVVSQLGQQRIKAAGQTLEATRYSLRGDLNCDLWYHQHRWVKLEFVVDEAEIAYRLQEPTEATG